MFIPFLIPDEQWYNGIVTVCVHIYIIVDDLGMNQHLRLRTRKIYFVPSQVFLAMSFFWGRRNFGKIALSCGIPVPKCWKIATVAWCSMALNGEIVRVVVRAFFLLHIMYIIYAHTKKTWRKPCHMADKIKSGILGCKSNTGTDHTRFRSTWKL